MSRVQFVDAVVLDELGGILTAAESGGWTPKARKKAEASLGGIPPGRGGNRASTAPGRHLC